MERESLYLAEFKFHLTGFEIKGRPVLEQSLHQVILWSHGDLGLKYNVPIYHHSSLLLFWFY